MIYRLTGLGWFITMVIVMFNLVVELPHFDQRENLGIGPKARARQEYERYQRNPHDRVFIRSMRERDGLPPVPSPPVDDRTPLQQVAQLTRTWLGILIVPLIPLTLCAAVTALFRSGSAVAHTASRALTTPRTLSSAPNGKQGTSATRELAHEIIAEVVNDAFWRVIGRKKS
jgi:hypothetical protein